MVSTLIYAGDGPFRHEEDLLNVTHFVEDLIASGWTPGPEFNPPPEHPTGTSTRAHTVSPTGLRFEYGPG